MFNFLNFGSLGYFFESNALDVGMLIQISLSSVLFGFGLFVYLAQRKSWKHAIFFFYCIAIFIALYCFGLAHLAGSAKSALEWYRFGFLGLFFTPLFSYILSIVVTERYRQIPIALAGVFIHSVFFVILLVFDDLPLPSLYSFQAVIFAGIFAVQAVGTSFNLVTLYRTCISRRQRSLLMRFLGAFVVADAGIIILFYHTFLSSFAHLFIGSIMMALSACAVGYMIVQYRPLNMALLTRKAVSHCILSVCVIVLYSGAGVLFYTLAEQTIPVRLLAQNSIFFVILFLCFALLKGKSESFVEIIVPDCQDAFKKTIDTMQVDLGRLVDVETLGGAIIKAAKKGLNVREVTLLLLDSNEYIFRVAGTTTKKQGANPLNKNYHQEIVAYLTKHKQALDIDGVVLDFAHKELKNIVISLLNAYRAEVLIPLFARDSLQGILFLGERLTRKSYASDELLHLSLLIPSIGLMIENAKLYEEIKSVSDLKSNIITITSHQLRTPISAIRWGLDLIMKKDMLCNVSPVAENLLKDIYKNNLRAVTIIDRLLDLSEIERRKGTRMHLSKVNLVKTMDELAEEMSPLLERKAITLKKDFEKKTMVIEADQTKIFSIFSILLENAIKYNKQNGNIEIRMRTGEKKAKIKLPENEFIQLWVKDTGIGIPKDEKKNIFKKFFRAKNARAIDTDGTGLGLAYAKSLIEIHSGEIQLVSEEGKGTEFLVTLPKVFKKTGKNVYVL